MLTLGLAGIVKNEIEGILEWIAYHRVLGVSKFFIADNESTDGTREFLSALNAHGLVDVIDVPTLPNGKPQLPAYASLLNLARGKCDVLAFIDADEFLLPTDGDATILPLIENIFKNPDISALALNWANFGSSGELFASDGLVIDRFTRRAKQTFNVHYHYKTLVRPECGVDFFNPHHVNLKRGRYVTAVGDDLVYHERHGAGLTNSVLWEAARVNHYATKSLEEFLLGKSQRGSASKEGRVKHKQYFVGHDRNDEECLLAKRFSKATQAEMNRLSALVTHSVECDGHDEGNPASFFEWISQKLGRQ
ncbi:glycosyltransferase family 92 protein [Burkholderia pseudomultivorans]|uniref:glycosyltransferase family 92 protein n=1 Tax=Burkholderia pseudomultivorans TaxID=1207504 RepID=UPI000ADE716D|nr:glycosyltransferase family 92 protein [Burkholderia pseudomultivorans]